MKAGLLDAALQGQRKYIGKVYFFKGSRYVRYDWLADRVDLGYPLPLTAWNLSGDFAAGIDAALNGLGKYAGKAYFFRGNRYVRYDWSSEKIDEGPLSLTQWKLSGDFAAGIDSALNGLGKYGGKAYFFRGKQYVRYDWSSETLDYGYPLPLSEWKLSGDFLSGIDAVVNGFGAYGGKAYFFRGKQYVRYDWSSETIDDGYSPPLPIIGRWNDIEKLPQQRKSPIILIPGIMGTSIVRNRDSYQLWPTTLAGDVRSLALDPVGSDVSGQEASPGEVIRFFRIGSVPVMDVYDSTFKFFANNGYTEGKDFFGFPYDWRKDLRVAAAGLSAKIAQVKQQTNSEKVILLAHSMGGLVARNYLTLPGAAGNVEKLFMLGTPHCGTPKAFVVIRYGKEGPLPWVVFWGPTESDLMVATANMLGLYQLLPSRRYEALNGGGFFSYNGRRLNLDDTYVRVYGGISPSLVGNALSFHDDLDAGWSRSPFPETYLMVGRGGPSSTIGTVDLTISGARMNLNFGRVEGDQTVTMLSGESLPVPGTRMFRFGGVEHGALARDGNVLRQVLALI